MAEVLTETPRARLRRRHADSDATADGNAGCGRWPGTVQSSSSLPRLRVGGGPGAATGQHGESHVDTSRFPARATPFAGTGDQTSSSRASLLGLRRGCGAHHARILPHARDDDAATVHCTR